jgi:hypothetical protein
MYACCLNRITGMCTSLASLPSCTGWFLVKLHPDSLAMRDLSSMAAIHDSRMQLTRLQYREMAHHSRSHPSCRRRRPCAKPHGDYVCIPVGRTSF